MTQHVRLDTDGIHDQLVRRAMVIDDDWQVKQGSWGRLLDHFLAGSSVKQDGCTIKEPAFQLICIAEKTTEV